MTKNRAIAALVLAASIVTCRPATAEPTPTVSYLMGSPVSLLDWGLSRLEASVHTAFLNETSQPVIKVSYDWHSNRIRVFAVTLYQQFESDAELRQWCQTKLLFMKVGLGVGPDGSSSYGDSYSIINHLFSHSGYASGDEPSELGSEIARLIEFTVVVPKPGEDETFVKCRNQLTDAEMLWTDVGYDDAWE